jgi:hypothetical protein
LHWGSVWLSVHPSAHVGDKVCHRSTIAPLSTVRLVSTVYLSACLPYHVGIHLPQVDNCPAVHYAPCVGGSPYNILKAYAATPYLDSTGKPSVKLRLLYIQVIYLSISFPRLAKTPVCLMTTPGDCRAACSARWGHPSLKILR